MENKEQEFLEKFESKSQFLSETVQAMCRVPLDPFYDLKYTLAHLFLARVLFLRRKEISKNIISYVFLKDTAYFISKYVTHTLNENKLLELLLDQFNIKTPPISELNLSNYFFNYTEINNVCIDEMKETILNIGHYSTHYLFFLRTVNEYYEL